MKINHQQAAFLRSIKKQNYPSQLAKIKSQPFLILTVGRRKIGKRVSKLFTHLTFSPENQAIELVICVFSRVSIQISTVESSTFLKHLEQSAEICRDSVMPYHRPSLAVVRPRRERSERPRRWPTGRPKVMGYAHAHNAKPGPQHHGTE